MCKITIAYEFDSIKDKDEFEHLIQNEDAHRCLSDFAEYLRQLHKYSGKELVKIEEVHNKFWEIVNDYKVEL
jgi:hypothetical protein